jgi:hypothetical protein
MCYTTDPFDYCLTRKFIKRQKFEIPEISILGSLFSAPWDKNKGRSSLCFSIVGSCSPPPPPSANSTKMASLLNFPVWQLEALPTTFKCLVAYATLFDLLFSQADIDPSTFYIQ